VLQRIEQGDGELGLAGAGRHRDQQRRLAPGQAPLDRRDGLLLIGPQGTPQTMNWVASACSAAARPSGVGQSISARRCWVALRTSRNQMPHWILICSR